MKILLSWSSGKDSAWALHVLSQTRPGACAALLTTVNEAFDRVAMHGVRREVLEAQARAAGLPLRAIPIPHPCPNEIYEARMRDAVAAALADGFTHVAFGDLFLEDVRRYREERLSGTGLTPIFPVWGIPTSRLADEMIEAGLRARLSCVDTRKLDASFAGREFDRGLLHDLPIGIDPCGENGEFHTCVYAGPMFRQPLTLETGEQVARDMFVWRDLSIKFGTPSTDAHDQPANGPQTPRRRGPETKDQRALCVSAPRRPVSVGGQRHNDPTPVIRYVGSCGVDGSAVGSWELRSWELTSRYPARIVCLTEETTETLYLLGEGDRVVGVSGYTVRPPEARGKPKVSAFINARFEKIEALEPDLILAFSDLQADIAAELTRRGYSVVTFNQRSVGEILQMIRMLGGLIGRGDKAEALASTLEAGLDGIRTSASRLPYRPRLFFEEWDDPLISGIQWVEELVEIAGGRPIFPELRRAKLGKDRVVSPDEVVSRDPEVIVASWCGKAVRKDKIAARPGWDQVSAVRSGHIYEIKSAYILQPGPASLTEGVRQLHDIISRVISAAPSA